MPAVSPFVNLGKGSKVEAICFMAGGEILTDSHAIKMRNLIISHKHGWVMTGSHPARIFEMRREGAMPLNTKVAYVFTQDTQQNKTARYDMDTDVISTVWDAAFHGRGLSANSIQKLLSWKNLMLGAALFILLLAVVSSFRGDQAPPLPIEEVPVEGEIPVEEGEFPVEGGGVVPVEEGEFPVEGGGVVPVEEGEVPVEGGGVVPVEEGEVPVEGGGAAPVEEGEIPVEGGGEVPAESGGR